MRWCFLQLGKTYATTKRKLGIPKDLVERSSRLSFCCRELICDSEVRASCACPSNLKPPNKNQSIMQILKIRSQAFYRVDLQTTNKKIEQIQCHSRGWSTARSTSQQVTKTRTHAHIVIIILGLSPNTWHKRMPHDSPFFFICWAFSSAQGPSEMIILTLPRRESF